MNYPISGYLIDAVTIIQIIHKLMTNFKPLKHWGADFEFLFVGKVFSISVNKELW